MSFRSKHPLFRSLTDSEEEEMRRWARANYKNITDDIKGVWHPVVRAECLQIIMDNTSENPYQDGVLRMGGDK